MSVASTTAKLLKHAGESDPQTCLGELSFGVTLEATVIAQGPLSVEKLYLGMDNTQAVIHEAIYGFAQRTRAETVTPPSLETAPPPSQLFYNLLPIIPKNFNLKIENSMLNGMRDDSKVDFSATLKSLLINTQVNQSTSLKPVKEPSSRLPQIFLSFQMETFDVKCSKNQVVDMSKLTVDGNYEEDILNVYVVLDKLTLSYEHVFMKPWVVNNFLRAKESGLVAEKGSAMLLKGKSSWFENFCNTCQISGCVELWKVCVWCHLPEDPQVTSVGFQHTKLVLEKSPDLRKNVYESPLGKLFFGKQHWSFELLVESCWCRIGNSLLNTDAGMLKKYHTWGTPLFIGVVLVKVRSQGAHEIKIHAMVDLFRTEWSPQFAQYLVQCLECAKEYDVDRGSVGKTEKQVPKISKMVYTTNLACTNANLYWLAEKNICLMARLDKLTVDDHKGKIDWLVEGAKISALKPTFQHSCVRSEEIKVCLKLIPMIRGQSLATKRKQRPIGVGVSFPTKSAETRT